MWLWKLYLHWSLLMWIAIWAWKSYKSSIASYCIYLCYSCSVVITLGNLFFFNLIYCYYSLLSYSCFELWSLYGLDGLCLVATPRTITHVGLILPHIIFWGLDILSQLPLLFWSFFNLRCVLPLLKKIWRSPCYSPPIVQTCYNSSLDPLDFSKKKLLFFRCNFKILVKHVPKQSFINAKWHISFLSSCFPLSAFSLTSLSIYPTHYTNYWT